MKFLLSVQPTLGHFHAMVPLGRALQSAGHEVAVATAERFGPVVKHAGLRHIPAGLDYDGSIDILDVLPEWRTLQKDKPVPVQQLYAFAQGSGPAMVDDLLALGETWRPDVVIRDPLEFGGYLAAECWGLPHATVMWAFYISVRLADPAALLPLRERYDLPADPELTTLDRYLVLDFLPAAWTFPTWPPPPTTHRFCAPPFDLSGDAEPPEWLEALPARPTVYATLGTTFNRAPETFQAVVDAFAGADANLVLTVGQANDTAQFQPAAAHIRVARYIPQSLLLPHCDAVIFHGGYNSLLAAMWHALPMVLLPREAGDNLPTAHRCVEMGLGVLVEGGPPAPDALRTAVKTVLEEPGYRARVRDLQREMRTLPPLAEAVERLEVLGRTREPLLSSTPNRSVTASA
jgi:UDP:flavonoid glycosyltransferase YjiC (YdhE family)